MFAAGSVTFWPVQFVLPGNMVVMRLSQLPETMVESATEGPKQHAPVMHGTSVDAAEAAPEHLWLSIHRCTQYVLVPGRGGAGAGVGGVGGNVGAGVGGVGGAASQARRLVGPWPIHWHVMLPQQSPSYMHAPSSSPWHDAGALGMHASMLPPLIHWHDVVPQQPASYMHGSPTPPQDGSSAVSHLDTPLENAPNHWQVVLPQQVAEPKHLSPIPPHWLPALEAHPIVMASAMKMAVCMVGRC